MKAFLLRFFTWWNGATLGTRFHTWRFGQFVGTDEFGNSYYRAKGHVIDPSIGAERRWVIYNGEADASKVPPGWRGLSAPGMGAAAPAEHDRHSPGLPSARLATRHRRATGRDRRLRALDAGRVSASFRARQSFATRAASWSAHCPQPS